jgi:tRNA 2-thiocytidine biosynthesis protein TtcA
VVKEKIPEGATTCSLCSRLRRGIIYTTAKELGATKIALGHHRDDIVETLFLNMFFGAKLKAMPPKLATNDKHNVVIRPLAYCAEKDIASYARQMGFPIIPCDLCGSQPNLQRQKVKDMLQAWEHEQPGRINNIFRAITNVEPSHLADFDLYDFKSLSQAKKEDEDPMFDHTRFDHTGFDHIKFGDTSNDGNALSLTSSNGRKIEFVRN